MFYACLSPLEIVHNLWYSAPLLLGTLICIISSKAEILKSPQFLKEAQRFGNPPRPKQSTLEMKSHQCDAIWSFMPLFALQKKEKPVCFLTLKKIVHVAGFGGVIKAEEFTYKLRLPVTLGRLLTSGPDFAVYPKEQIDFQLNRSFTK